MKIAFLLFDDITALDIVGPYEVLARLPGAEVTFVSPSHAQGRASVVTGDQRLRLGSDAALEDVQSADLLLVPGGFGTRRLERDERMLAWLRALDQKTQLTAAVCTGSILLAAAGLLKGRRATTHWARLSRLADYQAIAVSERVVRDGKYACAAGVSAGIDLALTLAIELAGRDVAQAIQLGIEYDPAPPLDAGSPARAPAAVREAVLQRMAKREAEAAEL
jgi:putative intracellular protease/amidase